MTDYVRITADLLQFFTWKLQRLYLQPVCKRFAEEAQAVAGGERNLARLHALVGNLEDGTLCPSNTESRVAVGKVKIAITEVDLGNINAALRQLLEARDCAMRAHIYKQNI